MIRPKQQCSGVILLHIYPYNCKGTKDKWHMFDVACDLSQHITNFTSPCKRLVLIVCPEITLYELWFSLRKDYDPYFVLPT